jgi:hypothetical protein
MDPRNRLGGMARVAAATAMVALLNGCLREYILIEGETGGAGGAGGATTTTDSPGGGGTGAGGTGTGGTGTGGSGGATGDEFDIEADPATGAHNTAPVVTLRHHNDGMGPDVPAFHVVWHAAATNELRGRQYTLDGAPLNGTGSVVFSGANSPEVRHRPGQVSPRTSRMNTSRAQTKLSAAGGMRMARTVNLEPHAPHSYEPLP